MTCFLTTYYSLLQSLKSNNEIVSKSDEFQSYQSPIERTSWIRKCAAKFNSGDSTRSTRWENCTIELEQTGSPQGGIDFGTLSVFGNKKGNKVIENGFFNGNFGFDVFFYNTGSGEVEKKE